MRVLYCTDTYPPQVNGVSVVTALSVDGLSRRGWEVAVVAPRYPDETASTRSVFGPAAPMAGGLTAIPSVPLPLYPDIRLAAPHVRAIERLLDRHRPHLVHCATEFVIGWLGARAARRRGIPVVTSYHTDFARYARAWGVPWLAGPVQRWLVDFHQQARRTYTPSNASAAALRAMGIGHARVWGCGVDVDRYHPRHRSLALRDQLQLGPAFTFGYVGRLAPEKNVGLILDAFARLQSQLPPGRVRLVVAGAGPAEEALRRRAPANTTFLGYLDRARDLPALYASLDAFVFASETETLGLVVLEAMSAGLPVLAAPAGGVAEHLRDDVNGLAYPAGDAEALVAAMHRIVADRDTRLRLAAGARHTAEALGWEAELDRLDASYREVLSPPPPAG